MRIHFNSFSNNSVSFLKDNLIQSLSPLQKKVVVVVSIIFACLAFFYYLGLKEQKRRLEENEKLLKKVKEPNTPVEAKPLFPTSTKIENMAPAKDPINHQELAPAPVTRDTTLNGQGKQTILDPIYERVEEGEFKAGQLNGKGTKTYANGNFEEGDFINGQLNGHGIVKWHDGRLWEGEWKNDKLEGKGKRTNPNSKDGNEEGEFKGGVLVKGTKFQWGGTFYEGEFVNESLHGLGKKVHSDGKVEEGTFEMGSLHGQGKIIYPDGKVEKGTFEKGTFQQGKIIYPDGTMEKGAFKKSDTYPYTSKLIGLGKRTYRNGKIEEGIFKVSESKDPPKFTVLHGNGKMTLPNGKTLKGKFCEGYFFEGKLTQNKLNGQGKRTSPDEVIEEGEFKDDVLIKGTITLPNGQVEEGEFKNCLLQGQGKITTPPPHGVVIEGIFEYGKIREPISDDSSTPT